MREAERRRAAMDRATLEQAQWGQPAEDLNGGRDWNMPQWLRTAGQIVLALIAAFIVLVCGYAWGMVGTWPM